MKKSSVTTMRPEWIIVQAFAAIILMGTFLLMLPFASAEGQWTDAATALFTSTSATCVTGLIVVDTGSYFSTFGQLVILGLIQAGGLGIMTLGTLLLVLVGRRLTMANEFVLRDSLGAVSIQGLNSLLARTVLFTLLLEGMGAYVVTRRLQTTLGMERGPALYHGIFHAISAFCNAGFSTFPDSLISVRHDAVLLLTMAGLIILGGLGFLVLYDVSGWQPWRRNRLKRGRLELHTRVVLSMTALLLLVGFVLFAFMEWRNTLTGLPWLQKLSCSFFQSVTPRTAGFNVVDMAEVSPAGQFMTMVMMFIGGAPGSTAGGTKVTTLVVLWLAFVTMWLGRNQTVIKRRALALRITQEATAIYILSVSFAILAFQLLLLTESLAYGGDGTTPFDLLFETLSALGTVGLSTGATPHLSLAGRLIIILCMFVGRLGPITVALIIGHRAVSRHVTYPEENIIVG